MCTHVYVCAYVFFLRYTYDIHVHERKSIKLKEFQHSALFQLCTPKNNLFGIIDIGAHKPWWLHVPFAGSICFMYNSPITGFVFIITFCTWFVCHLAIKIISLSLSSLSLLKVIHCLFTVSPCRPKLPQMLGYLWPATFFLLIYTKFYAIQS